MVLILVLILNVSCNSGFSLALVLVFGLVLDPASTINIYQFNIANHNIAMFTLLTLALYFQ